MFFSFSFHARSKDYCCRKNKVCRKSCVHFREKNIKSSLLGIQFSRKIISYKLQFTCYLYDAVNLKTKLSLNTLRTVEFYAILKNCNFEKKVTDFENRLKINLMQT